ncbi:MAG: hypothetical protein CVU56_29625, partial [Deltaproteobacteria bacterium HGW-Deltaproteobacteria-14]
MAGMSDDERRGPGDEKRPVRANDPRRSARGPVSTERMAHLDEALGFAPVDGEPPPLPPAARGPATGLNRRPPAAQRVAAAG